MWTKRLLMAAFVAAFTFPAFAQAPAPAGTPIHVRGTIEKFDGKVLAVKSREGQQAAITLADKLTLKTVKGFRLSRIKQGDYVGISSITDASGKMQAQEIVVLPEAMRGVAEGQFPWDLSSGSTMTNATVAQVAKVKRNRELQLTYKGGTADIAVAPGTPVVTFVDATARSLKPGKAVFVSGRKMDDGSIVSGFVVVQRGKVKPPL